MNPKYFPPNKYHPYCWIRGKPKIGKGTWIGPFTLIDAQYDSLKIGKWCDISMGAQIITHSTVKRCISERKYNKIDHKPTIIEDFVFIGTNAIILMGCKIGHHSVVAAGALIPENTSILPYSVVMGIPGQITKSSREYLQ